MYGEIVPGRRIQVMANGITIWTGYVNDWDLSYDVEGLSTAFVMSTDVLGMFGQLQFDAWTNSESTSTTKLDAICDRSEVAWPVTERDFGSDVFAVSSDVLHCNLMRCRGGRTSSTTPSSSPDRTSATCSLSADGVLTFRNRYVTDFTGAPAPVLTFANDGTGIAYRGIEASIGSERLFARVSVDREGGTAQTETVADTAAWIESYGPLRSLSIAGLLLDDDGRSRSCSPNELRALYDEPAVSDQRDRGRHHPVVGSSDQDSVLSLDITDRIEVTYTPNDVGSAVTQEAIIQGIRHTIGPDRHVVGFSLQTASIVA
jgi:hypothetical protein